MGTAAISFGPKLGLLNNAAIGETYYDQFRPFLRGMDALIQCSIINQNLTTPPSSPSNGDAYIVATGGTGVWSGKDNQIAVWSTQITDMGNNTLAPGWDFYVPKAGWIVNNSVFDPTVESFDDSTFLYFDGSAWKDGDYYNTLIVSNPKSSEFINIPNGASFGVTAVGLGANASIQLGSGLGGVPFTGMNGYLRIASVSEVITSPTYPILVDGINPDLTAAVSYAFDASSNNIAVTLPPIFDGIVNGYVPYFIITRMDATFNGSNTVTIRGDELISGEPTFVLTSNYSSVTLMQSPNGGPNPGVSWVVIAKV